MNDNRTSMTDPGDRVPKAYRNRVHRLKNAYRKAYGHEPEMERPVTESAAIEAIAFLEDALRRVDVPIPEPLERHPRATKRRSR